MKEKNPKSEIENRKSDPDSYRHVNHKSDYHTAVLYNESLDALQIKPGGIYVDCTFGGGGHSRGILDKLHASGRVIAFHQDADSQRNLPEDNRIIFVPHNF